MQSFLMEVRQNLGTMYPESQESIATKQQGTTEMLLNKLFLRIFLF